MSATAKITLKSDMQQAMKDFGLLQKDIASIRKEINNATENTTSFGLKFGAAFSVAQGLVSKVVSSLGGLVDYANKMDSIRASFNTIFEDGEGMFQMVQRTAEESTISTEELALGIQGVGLALNGNIPEIQKANAMIQDLAQGNTDSYSRIMREYTQALNAGKMTNENIKSMTNTGLPALQLLSESLGLSTTKIQEMASKGQLSVDMMNKAFSDATAEGGKFYQAQLKQSETLKGQYDSLKESVLNAFLDIWNGASPYLVSLLKMANNAFQGIGSAITWIKESPKFQALLAGLTAGIITLTIAVNASTIATASAALVQKGIVLATQAWTGAQWLLNAALTANPIGLVLAGIVALGVAIAVLINKMGGLNNVLELAKAKFGEFKSYVILKASEIQSFFTGEPIPVDKIADWEAAKKKSKEAADAIKKAWNDPANTVENQIKQMNKVINKPMVDSSGAGKSKAESIAETMRKANSQQIADYEKLLGDKAILDQRYQDAKVLQYQFEAQDMIKRGMNEIEVQKWIEQEKLNIVKKKSDEIRKVHQQATTMMLSSLGSTFNDLAQVMENTGKSSREFLIAAKAVAVTEATINSFLAYTKALASAPPPANQILATAALVAGMAKVAAIASTPIKAETGLQNYTVPQGYNNDNYPVMAKSGEQVTVTPKGESQSEEQNIIFNIDGKALFSVINQGIKNGQININQSNIGRRVYA